MERRYRIENLRRSLAMLEPGAVAGLKREEAMALLEELQGLDGRLRNLRNELRRLAEEP